MILNGDALEQLKLLDQASIDFICTDPPYGYSFMGKHWDKAVPSVELWMECLRVLKPGGFINVMSAPRSDVLSRMIVNLEKSGFRVDFTPIYWTYASGFPKAGNIGKLVDKRLGNKREQLPPKQFADGTTQRKTARAGIYSEEKGQAQNTKGNSPLEGSYAGFQPKPAVEVIIVAMKPLSEKTFVDQALANGKGISWLDDCRVPTATKLSRPFNVKTSGVYGEYHHAGNPSNPSDLMGGRFPANLLVSDDVLNDGTVMKDTGHFPKSIKSASQFRSNQEQEEKHMTGGGSYSRYFDLDKWASTLPFLIVPKASKSEKNKGLDTLETKLKLNPMRSANGTGEKNFEGGFPDTLTKNHHPTVKPLKLMSYLITLFSREGDVVLDPFAGSGTTCVAAHKLSRQYIGIELESEYAEIAKARLNEMTRQKVLL